ncbi:MAG: D-cysteine desulfhydrase family protein [Pyrinomonadaceae bacterium]
MSRAMKFPPSLQVRSVEPPVAVAHRVSSRLDAFARVECGYYPTPLEELHRLREALGGPRLLIKRDDLTGTGFGSNKVRKLDYVMARALADGATTVITIGGEKSNHVRVTAAVCARLGLRCVLVLNRAEPGTIPPGLKPASRFVYEMFGTEMHWVESREEREPAARALTEKLRAGGARAIYIPLGVSFPLGALGFVRAVREVLAQCEGVGARPNYVFHASTSGGTQAGMIVGYRAFCREPVTVVGVSPDDPAGVISARVAEIVNGVCDLLEADEYRVSREGVTILDQYVGPGYGLDTPEAAEASRLVAATEGIILDPVYTAKAMAALRDWIAKGRLTENDTVLFWHTGGQLALFYTQA